MNAKKSLLIGAAIASISAGGVGVAGIASAQSAHDGNATIVDRLVEKFDLNKDEVQAVFQEQHQERHAQMATERSERIADAVSTGKITQEQADYLTAAFEDIDALRDSIVPGEENDEIRAQVREKMLAVHNWADENDVDLRALNGGHNGHGGKFGGRGFGKHGQ